MWIDAVRGQDNTGAASVLYEQPDDYNLVKVQGPPNELFDKKSLDKVIQTGVSFLMGHNRSKTLGTTSAKNAHPFVFDGVIGAHNGTLTWSSKGRMKDDTRFETDSEAMYNNINSFGIEETIKKMDGAWALTWYDRHKKQINFLRNKERPLYYVLDDSNSTLYWASEAGMLYLILNRHGIPFNGKVKQVPENTWIRWQLNDKTGVQLDKPIHRPLVATPFVSYVHTHHGGNNVCGPVNSTNPNLHRWREAQKRLDEQKQVKNLFGTQQKDSSVSTGGKLHLATDNSQLSTMKALGKFDLNLYQKTSKDTKGFYKLWDNTYAFEDRFNQIMQEGCALCAETPIWTEPVKFLKDSSFICTPCMFDMNQKKTIMELISKMG